MGDSNAVLGEEENGNVIGRYGLGEKMKGENDLLIYVRRSPGDRYRNQLDYILTRTRYRNSVNNSLSYPGADIGSDHNLVIMTVDDIRLKKIKGRKKKKNSTCKSLKKIQIHSNITSRRNWIP